jgi:hypothetical protein
MLAKKYLLKALIHSGSSRVTLFVRWLEELEVFDRKEAEEQALALFKQRKGYDPRERPGFKIELFVSSSG